MRHSTFRFSFWLASLEGVIYLPTNRDYQFCTKFENTFSRSTSVLKLHVKISVAFKIFD